MEKGICKEEREITRQDGREVTESRNRMRLSKKKKFITKRYTVNETITRILMA